MEHSIKIKQYELKAAHSTTSKDYFSIISKVEDYIIIKN